MSYIMRHGPLNAQFSNIQYTYILDVSEKHDIWQICPGHSGVENDWLYFHLISKYNIRIHSHWKYPLKSEVWMIW